MFKKTKKRREQALDQAKFIYEVSWWQNRGDERQSKGFDDYDDAWDFYDEKRNLGCHLSKIHETIEEYTKII